MYPENTAETPPIQTLYGSRFERPDAQPVRKVQLDRVWLHVLLLLLTILSTTIAGSRMQYNFEHNLPVFDLDRDATAFFTFWRHPAALVGGLPFSLTLITILLAHEFGHYLACVYYGLDATLPYFIPFPSPIGTMGALIRVKAPFESKRALFDMGIAGPIAGFIFLLPALGIGLAFSKIVPGINHQGSLTFGVPPLIWLFERLIFPGVLPADIYLHPVARAAWVGVFATALNLLPVGQLDGGHILYALRDEKHLWVSRGIILLLIPAGIFFWDGWMAWVGLFFILKIWHWLARHLMVSRTLAAIVVPVLIATLWFIQHPPDGLGVVLIVLFVLLMWPRLLGFGIGFELRHPPIYDPSEPGRHRIRLGLLAAAIFLVCFMPAPIGDNSFIEVVRQLVRGS